MPEPMMQLSIFTPVRQVLACEAVSIVAVGLDGAFGIRARHIDIAAPLVPGILAIVGADGHERFVALDGGVLLKAGREVSIATRRAAEGAHLPALRATIEREFLALAEHERTARQAAARLEAGIVRRFLELQVDRP